MKRKRPVLFLLSQIEIADRLRHYQKRLRMGDELPSLTEFSDMAGLSRQTVYLALHGQKRISIDTQRLLSAALKKVAEMPKPQSRILHVKLGSSGPSLGFGVGVRVLRE